MNPKHSILITGMSGAGKSTVCRALANMGYETYDLDNIEGLYTMRYVATKQKVENWDMENIDWVKSVEWLCNEKQLAAMLALQKNNIALYCGDAANIVDVLALFTNTILLTVEPAIVQHRLTNRIENNWGKVAVVQEYIIQQNIEKNTQLQKKGCIEIDVTKQSIEETVNSIIQFVRI